MMKESTGIEGRGEARAACSHNEWDPLEEVVVGRVTGAACPEWHVTLKSTTPEPSWEVLRALSGLPVPDEVEKAAQEDLDRFIEILGAEGVRVRRPDPIPQTSSITAPDWTTAAGYNLANPRDLLLVVGDHIVEAPGAWRARYHELCAYRTLLLEYFQGGSRWTAAPRPRLRDSLYEEDWTLGAEDAPISYSINESEITFDAADFVRCGRDLFVTRSNVTNGRGVEWVRRHLAPEYAIHEVESRSRQPMHIDTTLMPLCPGKLLINPRYVSPDRLPEVFKSWEVRAAPEPVDTPSLYFNMSSTWLSMNVLMLDERRVVVERSQEPLMRMLRQWGFEPIPCPFSNYYIYGGAFHCATLDVRRRGTLQSYF